MTSQIWWFMSRGSGIVAWVLLAATCLWGILMVTRIFTPLRPAWMLDLHRWLGTLTIVVTGFHIGGLVADNYVHFGWSEVLLPDASAWRTSAVTWGVLSLYVLVLVQLSSLLMKRIPRRLWHSIHLSSYLLFAMTTVHAVLAGTDRGNRVYVLGVALAVSTLILGLTVRITRGRARRFARLEAAEARAAAALARAISVEAVEVWPNAQSSLRHRRSALRSDV
jgi:sulfoxide reductase heme-binding subunit YedZ